MYKMQLQFASAFCVFLVADSGFQKQTSGSKLGSGAVLGPSPLRWPTAGTAEPTRLSGKGAC